MATFTQYVEAKNKNLKDLSNEEIYYLLLEFVKEAAAPKPKNDSKRKVYYISAEFLIGKLLSNNLINLGIYKDVKAELDAAGKSISEIEDVEPEPSLGNGGLGRLASCFIDSMSTLGINGEGVGLNYHCGLFKQVFNYGLPAIGNALHIEFLQTSLLGTKWGAIFAAVFVLLWQGVAMPIIIVLAGLQSIPTEITEAARIDGATSTQVFWNIGLPYLLPSVSMVFILALKGGLTAFDQVFAMTGGGPNNATTSLGLLVYNYAFKNNQFGYANAIAVILFFLIVVISIIQLRVSKKFEI